MPAVSVIVPNYNHAGFLSKRFESIFSQTYKDFEVIILDDCSKDNSKEVIEKYRYQQNVSKIIYNDLNSGSPFKQWEKGIAAAKGKYIWIAESDDFCENNFLEVGVNKLEKSNAQIFVAKSVRIDKDNNCLDALEWWYRDLDDKRWSNDYVNNNRHEIENYLSKKCTIVNASAVIFENKKEVIGYFNSVKGFRNCGDWLFWLIYLYNSHNICYSVATTNYFRDHAGNTRATKLFERNFEVLRIYKWVCDNILNKQESISLISYYFSIHIYFPSRKKILEHLRLIFRSLKYTSYTSRFVLKYYLKSEVLGGTIK